MQILSFSQRILLFATLMIVPLGLSATHQAQKLRTIWLLHLASTMLLIVAFMQPIGHRAALLTLPWLLMTTLIALIGVLYLRQSHTLADGVMAVGMMYLLVGGVWVTLSCWGVTLGFGRTTALWSTLLVSVCVGFWDFISTQRFYPYAPTPLRQI